MPKTITVSDETWEKIKYQVKEKKEKGTIIYKKAVDGSVLYESDKKTIKEALEEAVSKEANLEDANLYGANLEGANLVGANLRGANLREANLVGANLQDANLREASFYGANLQGANLVGANLKDSYLEDANTKYTKVNFNPDEYPQAKQFIEGIIL